MEKEMRLDKYISAQTGMSRREASRFIRSGAVRVGAEIIKQAEKKLNPEADEVFAEGKRISYMERLYIMMNKPAGVLSASEDKRQKTVIDLLPPELVRRGLFPAGRLDKDTTGLLIITDDGAFAHEMLSPKKHIVKRYEAVTERPVTGEDIKKFGAGIELGELSFAPGRLYEELRDGKRIAVTEICEGKYHQVKRMFEATGNRVISLRRVKIGGLCIDAALAEGECRLMDKEEIREIFSH